MHFYYLKKATTLQQHDSKTFSNILLEKEGNKNRHSFKLKAYSSHQAKY